MIATRSALVLAIALGVLLAGCAMLSPRPDPRAADLQAMANATAKLYGKWLTPTVHLGGLRRGVAGLFGGSYIIISDRVPLRWRRAVTAHELGHYVNNDPPMMSMTMAAHSPATEMDANARAVEILVRLGDSEAAALREVYLMLREGRRGSTWGASSGHASACDEIRDLLSRFPTWRDVITPDVGIADCLPAR